MAEHTPTPWALMGRGDIIGVCKGFPQKPVAKVLGQETSAERAANTDLMIKAVNNHEALVKALQVARKRIEYLGSVCRDSRHFEANDSTYLPAIDGVLAAVVGNSQVRGDHG